MKKISLLLVFMVFASMVYSQPWLKNLPQNKSKSELNLNDYRNAFNTYWAPFNVENGVYIENGTKKKAVGWKQFKRWEYEMETQVNPATGEFPKKSAQEIYNEYLMTNSQDRPQSAANWTCLGTNSTPGGYAGIGRINCIAYHPTDNNTYWIGAASGGIWVTTNNGSTWTCLTSNLDALAVSDIVIPSDYATSNTIYIATGDKDHWDNRSIGVLKSTDGGTNWNATGISYQLSDNKMVNRLLLDPANNQNIIAATSTGVYKTTNGGTTWNTLLTSTNFIDMEYKPGVFTTLYGSTTNGTIYVSSNGGSTWTQAFSDGSSYRVELAVSANQPTWVYAVTVNSASGLYGVYKSTNSGTSYTQVFSGTTLNLLGWNSNGGDSGGQGWYDLCLAASPSDANTLLVGGVNTWRSTNGGTNWSIVNHWWGDGVPAVHADKHKLAFRANGDLFETNDGGVYISTNNGTGWTDKTDGITISQMYKLGVSQTVSNETITGLQDNGTKLLTGGSWEDVKGGDGMECLIDYTDVNIQYGTYVNGQIDRTLNHWGSATNIQPSGAGSGAWVTPYIIDPSNPQILYAGYADVWKTTNRGTSWTKISTMNTSDKIRSMAIAVSNAQVIYVASTTKIWGTTNGGTSWTDLTGTLPASSSNITYVTVKNDDANTLWVTLSGYNANKVYQSVNGGTTWTNISTGLPSLPAYAVVQNKQITSEVQLYVGTELGVYFKKGTDNWIAFNTGLPNVKIGEIEIYYASNPASSILRAATFGRGLWETPVFSSCTAPAAPVVGTITQPTCTVGTGSVVLSGLPAAGTWTINPGGYTGTGTTTTITGLAPGTYNFTVTDGISGCTSLPTANVVINTQPPTPSAPGVGTITQPTCTLATGSVVLNGLPAAGTWTINPGGVTGTGTTTTITGLAAGTYNFTVTDGISGCTSLPTANVIINAQPPTPSTPIVGLITQPTCIVATGGVVLSGLPSTGTWTINPGGITGTGTSTTISGLAPGTYNFTVTDGTSGCTSVPSIDVVINAQPPTPPTPTITQNGFVLTSDATTGNQWYNQTGLLPGATNQTYTVTVNGDYYDIVTLAVCPSLPSNIISITNVGIGSTGNQGPIKVYPNPVNNELIIELPKNKQSLKFEILNSVGQVVFEGALMEKTVVSTSSFTKGVYLIKFENRMTVKIVKN
ncbi:MAG: T9SS type A sorting domain-containing protein [Bacteroidetes bacterium]|nr:T9SS type A sorting domain-containing protein [Bacteroidota bacterium]